MSILDLTPDDSEDTTGRARKSQADKLVGLALELYSLGVSATGDAFGIAHEGPAIARLLRGSSQSLRSELSREYFKRHRHTPGSTALTDALTALQGFASLEEPTPLYLRHAPDNGALWVDLGDRSGRAVRVDANGWTVADGAPVTFRRSELTAALPVPVPGSIETLRQFLNVTDESWILIVGWLVSAYFPHVPHPIMVLQGEQGSAKSSTGRLLVSLVDPSPAPLRTAPRDVSEWATVADGSSVVALDNMSGLPGWLSDAMCRAVTGDGLPRRRLYSDSELVVTAFRKTLLLTGIDLGALSADLIDRSLFVELERIPPERRMLDSQIAEEFTAAYPGILGGLLDLVSGVMRHLPEATLDSYPRMADHARILRALDIATEGLYLPAYERAAARSMLEAAEGSPVAEAVIELMTARESAWTGTASDLLMAITPHDAPRRWPSTPSHLSGMLKRLAPVLRANGIEVVHERDMHGRRIALRMTHDGHDGDSQLLFE